MASPVTASPVTAGSAGISVAMATYNGARNLEEQLDSILKQSRHPAELVVCDDGSGDATVDILADFARTAPFPVHLHRNPQRVGPGENFFRAASMCRHDYVAFCDQDDIWRPAKLAACSEAIARRSPDLILHCYLDFRVDSHGRKVFEQDRPTLPHRTHRAIDMEPTMLWPGMAMVVRRSLIAQAAGLSSRWQADARSCPRPDDGYWHYNWANWHDVACLMAALERGNIVSLNRILAEHRTMAGGLFSDPAGLVNALPPILPSSPIRDDCDNYRRQAKLFGQLADFFHEVDDRQSTARYYRRWQDICAARTLTRARDIPRGRSLVGLGEVLRNRTWRGHWSGGDGVRSVLLDLRAVLAPRPRTRTTITA